MNRTVIQVEGPAQRSRIGQLKAAQRAICSKILNHVADRGCFSVVGIENRAVSRNRKIRDVQSLRLIQLQATSFRQR
jgi:hypothetical protein